MLKAATRAGEISFDLTKTIANFQTHTIDEIACCHSFARFRLDLEHTQRGLLATLHVLAAQEDEVHVERLFCDLGFMPYGDTVPCIDGAFQLTDRPGLGADPEPALLDSGFVRRI